jgi:FOG: PKD repeat
MIKKTPLSIVITLAFLVFTFPAIAQENPYGNVGDVNAIDVPVAIDPDSDSVPTGEIFRVQFTGAGYTHTVGGISVTLKPLLSTLDENTTIAGNIRRYGSDPIIEYELYESLIKERIILNSPETIRYSYTIQRLDSAATVSNEFRAAKLSDQNNSVFRSSPYSEDVSDFAGGDSIDILPDPWGNLVIYENGEDVVVMPRPFAIDATGKRFEMDFDLDKDNRIITLTGDLTGAQYPIVVDPTERITNGNFSNGFTGWTQVKTGQGWGLNLAVYEEDGNYYAEAQNFEPPGAEVSISQSVNFTGVSTLDFTYWNYYERDDPDWYGLAIFIDGNIVYIAPIEDWWTNGNIDVSALTGTHTIKFLAGHGYSSCSFGIDNISALASDVPSAPVANFTATPLSGTAPLTVQFNDTSTGSPTSWSWSFGDGGTSIGQNPSHTYSTAGTYTVNLTATNAGGSNTTAKAGYIVVTEPAQTTFYVYADGVSLYHGYNGNTDLWRANKTSVEFYDNISGKQGNPYSSIHWEGIGKPIDDATGSRNWNINEDANSKANNADFALHAGHGWNEGILFGTANPDYELFRANNLSFGGNSGKAKWVAFFSCDVLNQSTQDNWKSVFNGLHILMAFDTHGQEGETQGSQFAQRMTGDGLYPKTMIREAWKFTLRNTINDASFKGAYMWADPSGDDYLPGFGTFREPVKDGNGQYTINWTSFECNV